MSSPHSGSDLQPPGSGSEPQPCLASRFRGDPLPASGELGRADAEPQEDRKQGPDEGQWSSLGARNGAKAVMTPHLGAGFCPCRLTGIHLLSDSNSPDSQQLPSRPQAFLGPTPSGRFSGTPYQQQPWWHLEWLLTSLVSGALVVGLEGAAQQA